MKKTIIVAIISLLFSLLLAFCAYFKNKTENDTLLNANVDALASWEMPWSKPKECYKTISDVVGMKVYYCAICKYIDGCGDLNTLSTCYR